MGQYFLIEFELLNQALNLLHADIAAHDQLEAGVLRQNALRKSPFSGHDLNLRRGSRVAYLGQYPMVGGGI